MKIKSIPNGPNVVEIDEPLTCSVSGTQKRSQGTGLPLPLRGVEEQALLRRVASCNKVQCTGSGDNPEEEEVTEGTGGGREGL